jgi:hypothetical protein
MMNKKTPAKAPAKRRAPKKEPPIAETEILFCHLVLKGTGDPSATNLDRIEAAGAKVGYTKAMASKVYHRKPVQAWLEKYRERLMVEMAREDVRQLRRGGFTREDVLTLLHDLATMSPDKTKGSITGQVAAAAEMGKIMGLVVAPRDPDSFFKGRTEEEIAHFAEHGTFTKPVVM